MSWAYVHGDFYVVWFPWALAVCGVAVGLLLLTRWASLQALRDAGNFPCKVRYVRGARWGWAISIALFLSFVLGSSLLLHQRQWHPDMLGFIWYWAMAMTYFLGVFFPHELVGWLAFAPAGWARIRGRQPDWADWAEQMEEGLHRWWYGPLLCVPTAVLMIWLSYNMLAVLTWSGHAHVHRIVEIRNEVDAPIERVDATPYEGWEPPRIWVEVERGLSEDDLREVGRQVSEVLTSHAGRQLDYLIEIYTRDGASITFRYEGDRYRDYLDDTEGEP
jgi:hypothetical protein